MIIRKMRASYGKLNSSVLELSSGLNIISAPNESGKSTWCSFIKSMLYGIDSSARERNNIKPDKTLYAPWNGAPMSGSMELEHGGSEITITRTGKNSAPMRELTAVLSGTAQDAPGLTDRVGENLLGIPREVFERSAFIGQGSVAVTASPELEKRILSIVQTGDEGTSYTDAEERLRAAMRRRRHQNKSGRLVEIERELGELQGSLRLIEVEEQRLEQLRAARELAVAKRDSLIEKVAESRSLQRKKALDAMGEASLRLKTAEEEFSSCRERTLIAEQELRASRFGLEEPETVRARAEGDIEAASGLSGQLAKGGPVWGYIAVIILTVLAGAVFTVLRLYNNVPAIVLGALAVACAIRLVLLSRRRRAVRVELGEVFAKYGVSGSEELLRETDIHAELYAQFRELCEKRGELERELDEARRNKDRHDSAVLRDLDFVTAGGEVAALTNDLEEAESALRRLREELAACEGRMSAMGARGEISEKVDALGSEHKRLTAEYEALALAAQLIREAGIEMQNRMTPRLSARSSEIFSALTAGRYEAVALDRKLQAAAKLSGDTLSRESAFLSAGALDQLYLAVRLAICELALPEDVPLILDDALGSFDDERCRAALLFLREFASNRQVLLFTCHGREAQMMEQFSGVNIIKA